MNEMYNGQQDMSRQDEQPWSAEPKQNKSYSMQKTNEREKEQCAEEIYLRLDKHMQQALSMHEQLADYFCFLGLQGFKRKLEYQYMNEVAGKRKLHHKYINLHHKIIPMKQVDVPQIIPSDWSRYTTTDVNDNVLPKFVRSAMQRYKDWEEQTKQLYEELWQQCTNYGMTADADYISKLVKNVTKEIKEINRMCEQLNGTGYDSVSIHNMQDKYHKKYKSKYEDEFTAKERKAMKENKTNN